MDALSILDLQNKGNKNRWYQVEKITDRELIIRFPADDETTLRILEGHFRFVLMNANVFDEWNEQRKSGLYVGLLLGVLLGIALGFTFFQLIGGN